jgi:hypothetical protein
VESKGKNAETAEAAAPETGGEGEAPKKKKKKKKQTRMEGEGDTVVEEGAEVIPPTFDAQVGFRAISRTLSYHQDASTPGLRSYSLFPGPAAYASIVWYPLGPFTDGPAKNLGFEGAIEQAFGISSSTPAMGGTPAMKFGTTIHEFGGGVRYRMPWGPGHYFYGSLTGGEHAFTFTSTATGMRSMLDIPDTIYRFIRPGIGLHFEVVPALLSVTLSGGFRWVFNKGGQFHDAFFKHATVNGVDAQLMIAYRYSSLIEFRAIGDLRRYFSSMNCFGGTDAGGNAINQCDARFTAGGAVDQYISGSAMIAFTLGGSEVKTAAEAEEPPPPKRKRKVQSEEEEPPLGDDVKSDKGGGGDE